MTEQLYAVAKETATLEHENFRLAQESAVKAELKSVLDSWVRFEQQQREAEQIALVQSVRAGVEERLADAGFKRQLLEEALTQVEREFIISDPNYEGEDILGVLRHDSYIWVKVEALISEMRCLGLMATNICGVELILQNSLELRLSNQLDFTIVGYWTFGKEQRVERRGTV